MMGSVLPVAESAGEPISAGVNDIAHLARRSVAVHDTGR
jgi:hypothetical protein